jgi:hypothetical protein
MDSSPESTTSLSEIRTLLEQQLALVKDSNKIIHDMRKWGRVAFAVKVVAWTVVLILPVLLLPYLSPWLNLLPGGLGGGTTASSTSLFGFPSPAEILNFFHPGK